MHMRTENLLLSLSGSYQLELDFSNRQSGSYRPEPEFWKVIPVSYQPEPEFRQSSGIPVLNPVPVVRYCWMPIYARFHIDIVQIFLVSEIFLRELFQDGEKILLV